MRDADVVWTDEAVLRESWRWTHVPPGGTLVEDDRRTLVLVPEDRGPSRVWRSRAADKEEAGCLISETLAKAAASGVGRLIWHTGAPMSPPFMDHLLLERGFRPSEELEVLVLEMGDAPEPRLPPLGDTSKVHVRPARDVDDLRRAFAVDSEIFGSPAPTEKDLLDLLEGAAKLERRPRNTGLGHDGSLAFRVLASIGEKVVASAGAQIVGKTLRLWGAGTLEPHRSQGAYRALVVERCRIAHALGATLALTKANVATSAPTLRSAGFRPVSRERRLVLDMPT